MSSSRNLCHFSFLPRPRPLSFLSLGFFSTFSKPTAIMTDISCPIMCDPSFSSASIFHHSSLALPFFSFFLIFSLSLSFSLFIFRSLSMAGKKWEQEEERKIREQQQEEKRRKEEEERKRLLQEKEERKRLQQEKERQRREVCGRDRKTKRYSSCSFPNCNLNTE